MFYTNPNSCSPGACERDDALYLTENVQDKKIVGFDRNKSFKPEWLDDTNILQENIGQYGASLLFVVNEKRLNISAWEANHEGLLKRMVYIDTDEGPKDYIGVSDILKWSLMRIYV